MRSGRTTEEVEATYCSSVAGREGRGERIYVGVKRETEGKEMLLRGMQQEDRPTLINTDVTAGCSARDVS